MALQKLVKTAPILIKGYLSFATLTLMAITSMGIFGFLSKAYIEHQTTTEKAIAAAQVIQNKQIEKKISVKRQQEYIAGLEERSAEKAPIVGWILTLKTRRLETLRNK